MIANVNEQVWIDFSLDVAVFLDTIAYWLKKNAANKLPRNFHEGRYWTYNTLDGLHVMFPGWSKDTIRGIVRKCVKHELLIIGNFNKNKYDRTNWYSLTDKAIKYYAGLSEILQRPADNPSPDSCGEFAAGGGQIPTPIPKQLPTSSNNTITTSESNDSHNSSSNDDDRSDYHSNYSEGSLGVSQGIDCTGLDAKSDYHNNQYEKEPLLSKEAHNVDKTKYSTGSGRKSNQSEKSRVGQLMWEMIGVYREVFPDNPQPHPRAIATSLQKTLQTLIKRWHELDPAGKPFDIQGFKRYMMALRTLAPKFSLKEYETQSGNKKKNNMETFCRWNTLVKFLENQYS